jgi:hypothetical protein
MIKSSMKNTSQISVSCDISEVPKVNCTIIFSRKDQDLGPLGQIKFAKNRPIASATINLSEVSFDELKELLCLSTLPRPASLFLKTSKYLEGASGEATMRNSGLALEIYDLSWRFPVL